MKKSYSKTALHMAGAMLVLISLSVGQSVQAATYYWNNTTVNAYNTGSNWSDNATSGGTTGVIPGLSDEAVFNQSSVNLNIEITPTGSASTINAGKFIFNNTGSTLLRASSTSMRNMTVGSGGILINPGAGNVTISTSSSGGRPLNVNLNASQSWTNNSSSAFNIQTTTQDPSLYSDSIATPRTLTFDGNGSGNTSISMRIRDNSTDNAAGALSIVVNTSGTGLTTFSNSLNIFSGGVTVSGGVAVASSGTSAVAATNGALGKGATLINGGRLDSTAANALLGSSTVSMSSGELRATVANALATAAPVSLSGGTLRGFNAATTNFGGGTFNVTGNTTVVNDRSASGSSAINHTFGTALSVTNSQLNVTSNNYTGGTATSGFGAGSLSGNATLNVTDSGAASVLELTSLDVSGSGNAIAGGNGTVSVSGVTTVSGTGTLLVNGNLTATGGVTVSTGGTLGGSGIITGAVTVDGNLAPGNSPGLLTTGDLTLNSGANSTFQIDGLTRGTQYDAVNVIGVLTMGGTLTLDFGFTPQVTDTFDLFNFTSQTGSFSSVVFVDSGFAGTFDASTGILSLSAIPEPSTYAMLLGGLGLLTFLRRRRLS